MENSKSSLKDRLYEAMAIRGKKAVDLTRDLKIPKSAVSQYLSGKSQKMDSSRLYAIAKYLDVDEPWLLGYDVPMERHDEAETIARVEKIGDTLGVLVNNPKFMKAANLFLELDETDQDMILMLIDNLHQKTKKADT